MKYRLNKNILGRLGRQSFLLLMCLLMFGSSVQALSPEQKEIFQRKIYYFNIDACDPSAADSDESAAPDTSSPSSNPKVDVKKIASKYGLHSAVVKKVGGTEVDSYKAGERLPSVASVLKLLIADVLMHKNPDLNKTIRIKKAQLYSSSDATAGQTIKLKEVVQRTLSESSWDTGANILIDAAGGFSAVTSSARNLGYTSTEINNYYNAAGITRNGGNKSTASDLTKAMEDIFTSNGSGFQAAQAAMKGENHFNLNPAPTASKWGGTNAVSGNSALFNVSGGKYIVTLYKKGSHSPGSASFKGVAAATNEIVAGLAGSTSSSPASSSSDTEDTSSVGGCSCGGSDLSSAPGSDNNEVVYNFLRGKGLSAMDSAAIVGNFIVESAKDPISPTGENSDTHAYGIAQWLDGRLTGLLDYAKKHHGKKSDMKIQLNYLWDVDIPNNERYFHSLAKLKAAKTIEEKAVSWEDTFERSGGAGLPQRKKAAKKILVKYGSSDASTASSDTEACNTEGSGEVTGEFSLPVPKKFYDQHPDWFTKPHHDYPAADIPVPSGTKVFAVAKGKVSSMAQSGPGGGAGTHVFVKDGPIEYGYFHGTPGSVKVKVGDTIDPGEQLMLSDNTGNSTGAHLHFQIKIGGTGYCPQRLLNAIGKSSTPPDIKSLPAAGCTN